MKILRKRGPKSRTPLTYPGLPELPDLPLTKELVAKMGCTRPTAVAIVRRYKLGYKVGGRWRIYSHLLKRYLSGQYNRENRP